jgi:hypothetical protein
MTLARMLPGQRRFDLPRVAIPQRGAICLGLLLGLSWIAGCPPARVLAEDLPAFEATLPPGSHCLVEIEKLHPTQCAVGYYEVDQRGAKIAEKSPKKLKSYITAHLPLVVIGPGGVPYLVDGHHLCMALRKFHLADRVEARVEANWRDLDPKSFWMAMRKRGWVYPFDNQGRGPIDPQKLPQKIADMTDDPYRSLAWAVRKRDGYEKTLDSYAEFQWANFLRTRVTIGKSADGFDRAIKHALKIIHSPEAKKLPGYQAARP